MENLKVGLSDLEVKIEKYPLAVSPRLIEEFLIMGYTDKIKQEKVINIIKSDILSKNNFKEIDILKDHTINHLPSVISSITSSVNFSLIDNQHIIKFVFPIPPKIFYSNSNLEIKEPEISKIVFNNIQNDAVNIGYAYCFYEKENISLNEKDKLIFYFPKAFVIISQYNYFYTFHKICENLHKQYLSDNIEIPLEIQIYNIVNFISCPLDNKIELSIFPNIDLSSIAKCKNEDEFLGINKINQNFILEQLGGYKHTEINFCKILEILSPETIIQIYLQLFCGKKIVFFSEKKEILNYTILVFYHLLFPLAGTENVFSLNPNIFFNNEEVIHQNLFGFLTSYIILDFSDPKPKDSKMNFLVFEDEKNAERTGFEKGKQKCDFIVDIDGGKFKVYEVPVNNIVNNKNENKGDDNDDDNDSEKVHDEENVNDLIKNKYLFGYFNTLFNDNFEGTLDLDMLIRELYTRLKSLSILIQNENLNSFFVENEEIKNISQQIQEAFLRFNILICDNYFNVFSLYKGGLKKIADRNEKNKEEIGITEAEYSFYQSFEQNTSRDMLINLICGYDSTEPKIYKVSKRGFDNLLASCKEDKNNSLILKEHYIELLDCIFINENEKKNIKNISFFEFFKYFNDNLKLFVYQNINDDYLDKKLVKKENTINIYYKYKKIIIDKELLLKYCYYLDELSEDIKKKIFPKTEIEGSIEKIIYAKDFYKAYDTFLVNHKIYSLKNIIQFCVLNIVILSTSELKLIPFEESIYSLIRGMNFGIRKYVELILNTSYRVLIKKNVKDINVAKKYFDIYKIGIEEKIIFPNDELIIIEKNISKYIESLKEEEVLTPNELANKIQNIDENDLFTFSPETEDKNEIENEILEHLKKEGIITKNISLKSDLLSQGEIKSDFIYYPYTLYLKLNELLDKYYINLDIESSDKEEYYKLILNIIYYGRIIKDKIPQGILKFLFYCLCKTNDI